MSGLHAASLPLPLPPTNNNDHNDEDTSTWPTRNVCRVIQTELENMRRALTCPLCLGTLQQAVVLSTCVHAYCRSCLQQALASQQKCPTCLQACTRRSVVDAPGTNALVRHFKLLTRQFGLAPAHYAPQLADALTQLAPASSMSQEENPSQNSQNTTRRQGGASNKNKNNKTLVAVHEKVQAAKTFRNCLHDTTPAAWQAQQAAVVAVNERALVTAAAAAAGRRRRKPAVALPTAAATTMGPSFSQLAADVQEQAAANLEDDDNDDEVFESLPPLPPPPPQQHLTGNSAAESQDFYSAPQAPILSGPEAVEDAEVEETTAEASAEETKTEEAIADEAIAPALSSRPVAADEAPALSSRPAEQQDVQQRVETQKRVRVSSPPLGEPAARVEIDITKVHPPTPDTLPTTGSREIIDTDPVAGPAARVVTAESRVSIETDKRVTILSPPRTVRVEAKTPPVLSPTRDALTMEPLQQPDLDSAPMEGILTTANGNESTKPAAIDNLQEEARTSEPTMSLSDGDRKPAASKRRREQPTTTNEGPNAPNALASVDSTLDVGAIVRVQARTWPGVNKPGGVARVSRVHKDGAGSVCYNVAYVLGGKETRVDAVFVSPVDDDHAGGGKRVARRKEPLPPSLKAQLAAEGFDVATERPVKRKTRETQAAKRTVERPRKKQKILQSVASRLSKMVPQKQQPVAPAPLSMSEKEKMQLAEKSHRQALQAAWKKQTIHVVASSLSEASADALKSLVKEARKNKVSIKVSNSFQANKTNLCILQEDSGCDNGKPLVARTRTFKAMRATLAGIPIVGTSWIHSNLDSLRQHANAHSESCCHFYRSLPASNPTASYTDGVFHVAAAVYQTGGKWKFLGGHAFYLVGFSRQKQADATQLVRAAGATLLTHPSSVIAKLRSGQDSVVVLMDESSSAATLSPAVEQEILQHPDKVRVVTPQWLFDTISCGSPVHAKDYQPPGVSIAAKLCVGGESL